MEQMIREKLHKLIDAFTPILYEDDETFLRNMKDIWHRNQMFKHS